MWNAIKPSKSTQLNIRFKRNRYKEFQDEFQKSFKNEETDSIFKESGFSISGLNYQAMRWSILITWVIFMVYQKFILFNFSRSSILLWVAIFICTSPKKEIFSKKSPFMFITEIFQREYKDKKNKEIFRAISQLKNLSIAKSNERLGSDYILGELMKFTKTIKPIFAKMLSYWYEARQEDACEYFSNAIGTDEGKELANIFRKLDYLNPGELREQLTLYQSMHKEKRRTEREKKNESIGNWVYALVTVSALIVLINFLVVAIVIDGLQYYNQFRIGG